MRNIPAQFPGQCPVCFKFWEQGDLITRIPEGVWEYGWFDFGKRKGERWKKKRYWVHAECKERLHN